MHRTATGTPTDKRRGFQISRGTPIAMSTRGAKMSTPMVSPTQKVHQLSKKLWPGTRPASHKVLAPTVAPMPQLRGPPRPRNVSTARSVSSGCGKPTKRRTSHAPDTAWTEEPVAIAAAIAVSLSGPDSPRSTPRSTKRDRYTQNDPSQIPAQTRSPYKSRQAKAMPAGGNTTVA